ncbi:ABC transporter permease subunit [Xylophilus sp.]|uniref:ABC transporter permease subunit n=1 Tax=Xylophilus sp. TaxID=2653893 RepID=UPI0013B80F7E|nr:ABC transporter ATP-binding protein [Xylophilus sp.]KAF1046002.1 MAG: High-affinity branched-chain amino acid transport system permease protein LivH [Xylophilus sp.]
MTTSAPSRHHHAGTIARPSWLRGRAASVAALAVVGALLVLLPSVLAAGGQTWVRLANFTLLYVMLALGLNIVVGFAGLLDLGYIAFYAVGAYAYALLASPHFGLHLPFWVILPIGVALACLFGVLLGAPTLKLRGDYLAIVTLGFGEIIRIFLNNLNAPVNITNGPQGINRIDPLKVGAFAFSRTETILGLRFTGAEKYYYLLVVLVIVIMALCIRLQGSRIGRAWEAIREDETAAGAMGINTRNVKLLAFAMGASFGGVAGGLFAAMQGFVSPESFSLLESISVLCMVVLGGMGHVPGVILGAILLAVLPELLRQVIVPAQEAVFGAVLLDPEAIRMMLFGVAMVAVMLLRPAGLWPSPVRRRAVQREAGAAR